MQRSTDDERHARASADRASDDSDDDRGLGLILSMGFFWSAPAALGEAPAERE
jgi:hypothetical protein